MMKNVLVFGFAALMLAACDDNTLNTGTTGGGTTTGGTTAGGTSTGGTNPNPYGGFKCPADPANPTAPDNYYPGGPFNPNLGYLAGQTFQDIALGGGYWNLTTPVPVLDTQGFYQDQLSFHDLYCVGKFKVALVDISALWCNPCNLEGQDLPIHGAPAWLPQGGIIFSIMAEGNTPGSHVAYKADLDTWIGRHATNYPFVLSPDSLIASIISLPSWPTNIFVNLRDMTVLESFQGYQPCSGNTCSDMVYSHMTEWLNAIQ